MTDSTFGGPVMLPSAHERQQIFYWLQRVSSVTAWRRILSYFDAWALATKNSLRVADEQGLADKTDLPHSEYALILKCLTDCNEGVRRLAVGDKRVFKFDAQGEFAMAVRMPSHWVQMLQRIDIGDTRVNPDTPLWEPFCDALNALAFAWGECGPFVLESRFLEDAAPTVYGERLIPLWKTMPFPAVLERVPDPDRNTFVRTGQTTPYSGIWEPVDIAQPSKTSIFSIFTRPPEPQAPFDIAGVMNYLHGGSKAPPVKVETSDDIFEIETTWRMLWRDERYQDGSVPAIETGYEFVQPHAMQEANGGIGKGYVIICAESGDLAPANGIWRVESDKLASVNLQKGEKLPLHGGCAVRWVLDQT